MPVSSLQTVLKPFWRYYGGKWRAAPHYPKPEYQTIVEPFAGAAGYSLRYPHHNVILVEKYPIVAAIWRYLIAVTPAEILATPTVEHVDDLPAGTPQEARWLVGFHMNAGTVHPCKRLSAGRKKLRSMGRVSEGWTDATKQRIATQVERIRHWQIIEGDYTMAPAVEATWFIDPPYNNRAGSYYVENKINYDQLAFWCEHCILGQRIVCENEGASWLPFRQFRTLKQNAMSGKISREVIWP